MPPETNTVWITLCVTINLLRTVVCELVCGWFPMTINLLRTVVCELVCGWFPMTINLLRTVVCELVCGWFPMTINLLRTVMCELVCGWFPNGDGQTSVTGVQVRTCQMELSGCNMQDTAPIHRCRVGCLHLFLLAGSRTTGLSGLYADYSMDSRKGCMWRNVGGGG